MWTVCFITHLRQNIQTEVSCCYELNNFWITFFIVTLFSHLYCAFNETQWNVNYRNVSYFNGNTKSSHMALKVEFSVLHFDFITENLFYLFYPLLSVISYSKEVIVPGGHRWVCEIDHMNGHCSATLVAVERKSLTDGAMLLRASALCECLSACVCLSTYVKACLWVFGNLNLHQSIHCTVHVAVCHIVYSTNNVFP